VNSKLSEGLYDLIRESTRGIIFFGTPHQGGNGVTLGRVAARIVTAVGGSVSNDLLHYLDKDSANVENAHEDFRYQVNDYQIVTFFETRKTKLKKSGFMGKYIKAFVVDAKSAKMGVGHEIQLSMDSDHTMMCKFSGRDHMYDPVGGQLRDLVRYCMQPATTPQFVPVVPKGGYMIVRGRLQPASMRSRVKVACKIQGLIFKTLLLLSSASNLQLQMASALRSA
jgi:hypothetical protein